jgi:hypothetical protein
MAMSTPDDVVVDNDVGGGAEDVGEVGLVSGAMLDGDNRKWICEA